MIEYRPTASFLMDEIAMGWAFVPVSRRGRRRFYAQPLTGPKGRAKAKRRKANRAARTARRITRRKSA